MRKRVLSLCMALAMCFLLVPVPTLADKVEDIAQSSVLTEDATKHMELGEPVADIVSIPTEMENTESANKEGVANLLGINEQLEKPNYSTGVKSYEELESRLQNLIAKYNETHWTVDGQPKKYYGDSKYYYGWQCNGFAKYIFNDLFCKGNIGSYNLGENERYYLPSPNGAWEVGKKWNINSSDARSLLSQAQIGDYLQVRRRRTDKIVGHSMIVAGVSTSGITIFDCNSDGQCTVKYYSQDWETFASKNIGMSLYRSTAYPEPSVNHSPMVYFDGVESPSPGQIHVAGWAFDPDDINAILDIHVYAWDDFNNATPLKVIQANVGRADVDAHHHCGAYHGFDATFPVDIVGEYRIQCAAINIGEGADAWAEDIRTVTVINQSASNPTIWFESADSPAPGQVHVTGWAFDSDDMDAVVDIHVYAWDSFNNATALTVIQANVGRADVDAAYHCGEHHGFDATFNVGISGEYRIQCAAINVGKGADAWAENIWTVIIPPNNAPALFIDVAESNSPEKLHIRGWAFDPDNTEAKLAVHVYVGNENDEGDGYAIIADKSRPDVDKQLHCGEFHGFDDTIDVSPGTYVVRVAALDATAGGYNAVWKEYQKQVTVLPNIPNHTPMVAFDLAESTAPGKLRVYGWAFDPDDTDAKLTVHVYVGSESDNGKFYRITADKSRPDVDKQLHCGEFHGFDDTIDVSPGTYVVRVAALDSTTGHHNPTWQKYDEQVTVSINNPPMVALDLAESTAPGKLRVYGWAFDPDDTDAKLTVHVYVGSESDNGKFYRITADKSRPDVDKQLHCGEFHGFDDTIDVSPGTYVVRVAALDSTTGHHNPTWQEYGEQVIIEEDLEPSKERNLMSIEINSKPTKTVYDVGDAFDSAGLSIKATYSNGDSEILTSGFSISDFDSSSAGTKDITVTYHEKTASFSIVVKEIDKPQIVVGNGNASRGMTIDIPVTIQSNPGIAGAMLAISYDKSALTLNKIAQGPLFEHGSYSAPSEIGIVQWYHTEDVKEDGVLFILQFTVNETAQNGNYNISVGLRDDVAANLSNADSKIVDAQFISGVLRIESGIRGDVTGDGVVAINDVVKVARAVAGSLTLTESEKALADVTGDGVIAINDVVKLARYVAGSVATLQNAEAASLSGGESAVIEVATVSGKSGGTVQVPVSVTSNPGIAGAQLDISFDEGLTLKKIAKGDILSAGTFNPDVDNGRIQWYYDQANITNIGVLFTLEFEISANANNGDAYAVTVNVKDGITANLSDYDFNPVNAEFKAGKVQVGDTSGNAVISTVSRNGNTVTASVVCGDSNASVFCGVYNNSGKMIAVRSVQITSESTYQFQFDGQKFDYAKVFILDSNFCPLCESKRS